MSEAETAKAKLDGAPLLGNLRRAGLAVVGLGIVAGIAAAWRWRGEFDPVALTLTISVYPAAPLVFLGLHLIASLTFMPRTLLGIAAGVVFGAWWGLLWASLGGVLGAIAGFAIARYLHSGLFERQRWEKLSGFLDRAAGGGWRVVTLIRLVPVIPHSLANYAFGLTRVRLGDYAFGSLLGQLPTTVAAVDLGAAGEQAVRGTGHWLLPTAIGFAALALSVLIPWFVRKRQPQG
ncbi:MAG TPA: TVP38/TMEM64 family protein [Stellaceae bacterium]|nr:TVP38/TMEM64 family protein [Stellaceae bacterium]